MDVLKDHVLPVKEVLKRQPFVWPSITSENPETITFSAENGLPTELSFLPQETKQLIYFSDFFLVFGGTENKILGALHEANREYNNGHPIFSPLSMAFEPNHEEFLQEEWSVTHPPDDLAKALNRLPTFLAPNGLYYQLKPDGFPPHHQIEFENLLHLQQLLEKFPKHHSKIKNILEKSRYLAPDVLIHINTSSEIDLLDTTFHSLPQEKIEAIARNISTINSLKLTIPWEDDEGKLKPGYKAFTAFSQALTQEIFLDMINNPDIHNEVIQDGYVLAFKSLGAVGYLASDPEVAHQIFADQSQAEQEHTAHAFSLLLHDQKANSLLPLVPIVMHWTQKLGDHAPSGMTPEATREFYEVLTNLNQLANETTGDTEQELELLQEHLSALDLPQDFSWLDAGSGDGSRILGPLIDLFIKQGFRPQVQAVDLLSYPQPEDQAWTTHQADITNPDLLDHVPAKDLDLITATWSVLNDLTGLQRLQALANFNQALKTNGYVVFDVTVGYQAEEANYRKQHPTAPPGSFTRDFLDPNGAPVEKGFQATRPAIMRGELTQSGFRLVKEIAYTTKAGYQRKLVIAQKTGDPLPTPPKPWQTPAETTISSSEQMPRSG